MKLNLSELSFDEIQEIERLQKEIDKDDARKNILDFTTYTKPDYEVNWHHKVMAYYLDKFVKKEIKRLMLFAPPRHGKLCADDTPVFTPKGWVTHGDLKKDDEVFHPSGKIIKVLAKSKKSQANMKVTFSDGSQVECHENHEWAVYDRSLKRMRVLETKELKTFSLFSQNRCKFQLPETKALEMPEATLSLPPYVLGAWLGDGTTGAARISYTPSDRAYIDKIVSLGYDVSSEYQHKTTGVMTTNFAGTPNRSGRMTLELQALGVFNKKGIPDAYKYSSVAQRLELIAGLVDTDGHVEKKTGRVRIVTASKELSRDIWDVASSLGWRPYITEQKPSLSSSGIQGRKIVYTVGFQPDRHIPTVLDRKKIYRFAKRRKIGIVSVETVIDPKLGHCVQVDSPDGLYLVGKTLLPTHNSELVSRRLPPFIHGINPNAEIIGVTYNDELASDMQIDAQRIIDSPEYRELFPRTQITPEGGRSKYARNSNEYEIIPIIEAGEQIRFTGSLRSVGVGGSLTGRGADYIVIDDIIKNRADADSKVFRDTVYKFYTSTVRTRLEKDGAILLTLTRWSNDDLAGRLLELAKTVPEADQWTVVILPAEKGDDDNFYDHRETGEFLWTSKYSEAEYSSIKHSLGSRDWAALYQQSPMVDGGNIIKRDWIRTYKQLPDKFDQMIQSWDLAFKDKTSSDFSVCTIWGRIKADIYLIHEERGRWDFPTMQKKLLEISKKFPTTYRKLVEDKANGSALMQSLAKVVTGLVPINPVQDKVARVNAVAPMFESGNVYVPDPSICPWIDATLNEWCEFPNGAHDDRVDSMSQALADLRRASVVSMPIAGHSGVIY